MVSSGAIIREHCEHVAVCGSAIKHPRRRRGRISQCHRGRTPACVNPVARVTGHRENSTERSLHDRLLRQCYYSARRGRGDRLQRRARRCMQVDCSKCSQPIALTDIIESFEGRLSHTDCKRPNTLTAEERGLVFFYCVRHAVAYCLGCDLRFRLSELAPDVLGGWTNVCPRCRRDLTASVRAHLFSCALLPAEVRLRAQTVREAARRLVKQSQQARDRADVLMREAEAALFDSQRALREAMSRRTAF